MKMKKKKILSKSSTFFFYLFYNLKQMDKLQNPWLFVFKFKTS